MEQALETQRLKLLRLLAGLAVALGLLSLAPAVSMLPRWVRSYVASVLVRAESAVHSLVIVAACGLLRAQTSGASVGLSFPSLPIEALPEETPSTAALFHRIKMLQAMLGDLPRQAERMVARMMKRESEPRERSRAWDLFAEEFGTTDTPVAARIERPPDKQPRSDSRIMDLLPPDFRTEGVGVCR